MDESIKTYVAMCDCEEIQNHEPEITNETRAEDMSKGLVENPRYFHNKEKSQFTWLPRQEDIQEMLLAEPRHKFEKKPWAWFLMAEAMVYWVVDRDHCALRSLNELWLMYYMAQAHNKYWTGEEWEDNYNVS